MGLRRGCGGCLYVRRETFCRSTGSLCFPWRPWPRSLCGIFPGIRMNRGSKLDCALLRVPLEKPLSGQSGPRHASSAGIKVLSESVVIPMFFQVEGRWHHGSWRGHGRKMCRVRGEVLLIDESQLYFHLVCRHANTAQGSFAGVERSGHPKRGAQPKSNPSATQRFPGGSSASLRRLIAAGLYRCSWRLRVGLPLASPRHMLGRGTSPAAD
jgi:hypothetical protein